jgi:hypothetical protein
MATPALLTWSLGVVEQEMSRKAAHKASAVLWVFIYISLQEAVL